MGIEGIEKITENEPATPPLPDDEAVERQKREEEGIEPSEPIEIPAEESTPPNPGGGNTEEK